MALIHGCIETIAYTETVPFSFIMQRHYWIYNTLEVLMTSMPGNKTKNVAYDVKLECRSENYSTKHKTIRIMTRLWQT